jgi:hypothetical protein
MTGGPNQVRVASRSLTMASLKLGITACGRHPDSPRGRGREGSLPCEAGEGWGGEPHATVPIPRIVRSDR